VITLLVILVAALAIAAAAQAHGPPGGGVGYESSISGLKPRVLGVLVNVLGGDDRLQLVNYSGKTIVVLGYEGEPFLRFTSNGVYENVRSPATYLSRERDPDEARVPASADAKASPVWRKATRGSTFGWHDHRIRWTGSDLPPAVERAPSEIHLIFRWRVPALADGKRFAIEGFLGYRPPAETASESGTSWWVVALAAGGIGAAAAAMLVGARLARRRAP
jgi:hypothetical protein